ncbi:MAG: hypothetical protein AVDCRST_MAG51-86, partial [uncultured Ramlibacter sp.]
APRPAPHPCLVLRRRWHHLGHRRPHRGAAGQGPARGAPGERPARRAGGPPAGDGGRDTGAWRLCPAGPPGPGRAGLAPAQPAGSGQAARRRPRRHPQPRGAGRSAARDDGRRAGDAPDAGHALSDEHHLDRRRSAGGALPGALRRAGPVQGGRRRADHRPHEAAPGAAPVRGAGDGRAAVRVPDDRRHHHRHPHRQGRRRPDRGRAVRLRHRGRAAAHRGRPDPADHVRPAGRARSCRGQAGQDGQPGTQAL